MLGSVFAAGIDESTRVYGPVTLHHAGRIGDARAWRAARSMIANDLHESYSFEPEEYWFYFAVDARMRIMYHSGSLVSILQDTYTYVGGAHGMSSTWPLNLAIGASGPREYGLAGVFLAGTGWEKKVSDYVIKSLRTQGASNVLSGETRAAGEEMLVRFAVSPVGIDFYFAPHERGAQVGSTGRCG